MTSPKTVALTPEVHSYLLDHSLPLDDVQLSLIAETRALGSPAGMQIAPEQGTFLTLLTRAIGARRAIEVGTFTGYSGLCIARGLPPEGSLLCCDISAEWTAIGRRHWEAAGVADRIELRIAPAIETLQSLPRDAAYDLAFIDADKRGYAAYLDELVPRLRSGGVLLVDNVLWSGRLVDRANTEADTEAIRAFNTKLAADDRLEAVILPIADGLTFARKR